jgi:uncharacterized membrane protein
LAARLSRRLAGAGELKLAALVTGLATPVCLAACAVPDGGLFRAERYRDVHLYGLYADQLFRGELPYRDVFVEYPPGAFAVFLPPAVLPAGDYNFAFKSLMAACGLAALFAVVAALLSLGVRGRRLYAAAGLFALSPLAVGPISLNTYDLWPAALTAGALAALFRRRELLAFALLGLAVTAKLYPLVLVLPALGCVWAVSGPRRARDSAGVLVGVAALVVLPFALFGLGGLWDSFHAQAARGLQIESLGSALLLAAHRIGLYDATVVRGTTGAATRDLAGSLPDALATVLSVLQLAVVALVWIVFFRGPRTPQRLALASAAAVAGFLVCNRFISPQYLVWLIPLVLLVESPAAIALVAGSLVLAQIWFFHYRDVFALDGIVWLVVARDLALVALYVGLLFRLNTSTPSSENTSRQRGLRRSRASPVAVARGSQRSA